MLRVNLPSWAVPLMERWFPCYTILYGPLVLEPSREEEVLTAFLDATEEHLATQGGIMVRRLILPLILPPERLNRRDEVLRSRGYSGTRWGTFVVDLRAGREALWEAWWTTHVDA